MKVVAVDVYWISDSSRYRSKTLSSVARFSNQTREDWQKSAWSVVINFPEVPPLTERVSRGEAKFLSLDAPHDWLSKFDFKLLDREREIADVKTLSNHS